MYCMMEVQKENPKHGKSDDDQELSSIGKKKDKAKQKCFFCGRHFASQCYKKKNAQDESNQDNLTIEDYEDEVDSSLLASTPTSKSYSNNTWSIESEASLGSL